MAARTYRGKSWWGLFDPSRPERSQRNRLVSIDLRALAETPAQFARTLGLSHASAAHFRDASQGVVAMFGDLGVLAWRSYERALLCDGPSLLC